MFGTGTIDLSGWKGDASCSWFDLQERGVGFGQGGHVRSAGKIAPSTHDSSNGYIDA